MTNEQNRRWRLILGQRYSHTLNQEDALKDQCLDQLYSQEYKDRFTVSSKGGINSGLPSPITWLSSVKKAFPKSTVEILQQHGLARYGLTSLLLDEDTLKQQTADLDLLQLLLSFREQIPASLHSELERIIQTVCKELEEVLVQQIRSVFSHHRIPMSHAQPMPLSYTHWHHTIKRNLKHYQIDTETFILERPFFYQTQQDKVPWDIHLVVDQSGSMLNSLIHAAVVATIFCRLPMLNVKLYLFDTRVVDVTDHAGDPLAILLNSQLGGGTNIGLAMQYTHERITDPARSMVVLISDFYEGGSPASLYHYTEKMHRDGVTLLGLTALDTAGIPQYDNQITNQLLHKGMEIASMTPEHLSQWVAEVIK
ncbi:VWA domain-containing protein [Vibrio campbellii]|uniref:VWA domain-containing protein n=1 Tax=Vibrio campbellii TaxID=680 RepID=UPI00210EE3BF|nr:VWA domain-containing protein [Vibrio campbellii]UTZ43578.1 VWA domain-containing protein [Vibrio campbellii]